MTITEFFLTYKKPTNDNKFTIVDSGRSVPNIPFDEIYGFQHIIFDDIQLDSEARCNIIQEIFTHTCTGVSIYFDDNHEEFIEKLKVRFTDKKFNSKDGESTIGIAIQHIEGIGYIISSICGLPWVKVQNYTLSEYVDMMDKYVVVAIAKNEKHYIKDWVAYHLRIGFDKIYLHDNNDIHGESYDELLSEYTKTGQLEIINIRGLKGTQNTVYNMFYYLYPFKWMAVIDIDEFIWFNETGKYCDIKTFLSDKCKEENRFGIMLQWHCYASSGEVAPSDKPIWEVNNKLLPFNARKDCRCEYIHNWCKSIYKPGYRITLNEHFGWENDHTGMVYGCSENDCDDKPIIKDNMIYIPEEKFLNQPVYVKHFLLRNIDDFYYNKYFRGHAGADFGAGVDGWAYYQWRHNINYYTDTVGVLNEREQIYLNKHGMKMNYTFHPDVFINWYVLPHNEHINATFTKILCDAFLPYANCFLNKIEISVPKYKDIPGDGLLKEKDAGDIGFLARYMYNYNYFDVFMDDYNIIRKNVQDPIVINIGIPLKFAVDDITIDEQKYYAEFMTKVFNKDSVREYLRTALDYGVTTIPSIGIMEHAGDCMGFHDVMENMLNDLGLQIPQNILFNNTMVMPYNQYINLKKFQNEFVNRFGHYDNKNICESIMDNVTTPYHAYICTVMSIIKNPFYVWPN